MSTVNDGQQLELGPQEQWWCPTCDRTYPKHASEDRRFCTEHWPTTLMQARPILPEGQVRAERPLGPRARRTDPETSHAAARSVKGLRESHEAVLRVMHHFGAMTDEELVRRYINIPVLNDIPLPRQSESGIRTRRRELADMSPPRVVDSGDRKRMDSGRRAIVWRLA